MFRFHHVCCESLGRVKCSVVVEEELAVDGVSHVGGVFVVEVVDMAGSSWLRVGRAFQERCVPAPDYGLLFRVVCTVGPSVGANAAELAFERLVSQLSNVSFDEYKGPCSDDP